MPHEKDAHEVVSAGQTHGAGVARGTRDAIQTRRSWKTWKTPLALLANRSNGSRKSRWSRPTEFSLQAWEAW